MRKYGYLAVAAAGVMVLAAPVGTALAATAHSSANKPVLLVGSAKGKAVKNGAKLGASLAKGTKVTFKIGSASASCTVSTFSATVTKNPSAAGKATLSVKGETVGGTCTLTGSPVAGTTLTSLTAINLPYNATVTAKGLKITVTETSKSAPLGFTAVVDVPGIDPDLSCTYEAASASGTLSNKNGDATFTNQALKLEPSEDVPTNLCSVAGTTSTYSAVLGPVTDNSVKKHPRVYVS